MALQCRRAVVVFQSPIDQEIPPMSVTNPAIHGGATFEDHPVTWIAHVQGDLVSVHCCRHRQAPRPVATRGTIVGFSRASRWRLLKWIATIDWPEALPCLFITLTYPDECVDTRSTIRNKHRYLFHRRLEKALAIQLPMIWRVEWKPRQSGVNTGKYLPHIHLLVFGVRFIAIETIRAFWNAAIGHTGWCSLWVEECGTGKHAALYVAKYCAKIEAGVRYLDKGAYLNTGRQYGFTRKHLIPLHPLKRIPIENQAIVDACRIEAHNILRSYDLDQDESFTVLGDRGEHLRHILGESSQLTNASK